MGNKESLELEGKVSLVTGASRGIGRAIALKLASLGSKVVICDIAKEAAEGAYIIGEGLLGGKYKGIVDCLELRGAKGTMHDYILLKGVELEKP